jgi:UrcA family protein
MSNFAMRATFVIAVSSLAPLHAQVPDNEVPRVVVNYADLDLTRAAGDHVLYQRIRGAAQSVCRAFDDRNLAHITLHRKCVESAVGRAVANIDHPDFRAYYATLSPKKSVPAASGAAEDKSKQRTSGV